VHGTDGWYKLSGVPDWEVHMMQWLNQQLHHEGPIGEGIQKRDPPQ
jgi:hypothetical protein